MKRWLWSVAIAAGMSTAPAYAEFNIGGGLEYFDWREDTTPQVTETGPLIALHINYVGDKPSGILFGGKGRLWTGSVNYEGSTLITNQPLSGTTDYAGIGGEGQLRFRSEAGPYRVDLLLALGMDAWERRLTSIQSEDFFVLSTRLAAEFAPSGNGRGLLSGVGIKYPFYVRENAHFDKLGARNNPTLEPKGALSASAHVGYRIDSKWQVIGYYESIWLRESAAVFVDSSSSSLPAGFYFQPTSHMNVLGVRVEYRLR